MNFHIDLVNLIFKHEIFIEIPSALIDVRLTLHKLNAKRDLSWLLNDLI